MHGAIMHMYAILFKRYLTLCARLYPHNVCPLTQYPDQQCIIIDCLLWIRYFFFLVLEIILISYLSLVLESSASVMLVSKVHS